MRKPQVQIPFAHAVKAFKTSPTSFGVCQPGAHEPRVREQLTHRDTYRGRRVFSGDREEGGYHLCVRAKEEPSARPGADLM